MTKAAISWLTLMIVPFLASCDGFLPFHRREATATPVVTADTFLSGCAYLDENGNEAIDSEDPMLGGMAFTVTLAGGATFRGVTTEEWCAFVTVPMALPQEAWPILSRMEAPEGSLYECIGPSEITLEYRDTQADFLFGLK